MSYPRTTRNADANQIIFNSQQRSGDEKTSLISQFDNSLMIDGRARVASNADANMNQVTDASVKGGPSSFLASQDATKVTEDASFMKANTVASAGMPANPAAPQHSQTTQETSKQVFGSKFATTGGAQSPSSMTKASAAPAGGKVTADVSLMMAGELSSIKEDPGAVSS